MSTKSQRSAAAAAMGAAKSPAKAAAARENGKKGGRPPLLPAVYASNIASHWIVDTGLGVFLVPITATGWRDRTTYAGTRSHIQRDLRLEHTAGLLCLRAAGWDQ